MSSVATKFVDLETAQASSGLTLVVLGGVPSPWSEAAKGIFRVKGIPFVALRMVPGDKAVREWTRSRNAPVAMLAGEPPRTGWAEILELAERMAPAPTLVPKGAAERARAYGLAHTIMGEGGLVWSARLLTIDAGLRTEGARGFAPPAANYLASRYGYDAKRIDDARARVGEALGFLTEALADGPYFFGDQLTAVDVYAAAAMNLLAPPPHDECPMLLPVRAAFESLKDELPTLPDSLLALRQRMYERHLERPIVV